MIDVRFRDSASHVKSITVLAFTVFLALHLPIALSAPAFRDPLDYPAVAVSAVADRPTMAIASVDDYVVAVGPRGLIIRSEDQGKTWVQSSVPVQSDLLAVHFPNARDGWAVGHDGVILHSSDGGRSWIKQLDGRIAAATFKNYYAAEEASPAMEAAAFLVELNFRSGPSLPYLDVWFEDAQRGFVVGSFGMIAATDDGGQTWTPWMHRIDNDEALHLNSIRGIGGNIFIAGEHGSVLKLDRARQHFMTTSTDYAGSFFGITGNRSTLLAYGLRGTAYRSEDSGISWQAVEIPSDSTLTAGAVDPGSDRFVLVNSAGQFLLGDVTGSRFNDVQTDAPMRYTGVVVSDGVAVVSSLAGTRSVLITDLAE